MQRFFPLFLIAYEFTLYLSNDMYLPAFLVMKQDFATSESLVQYTLTSWLMGNSVAQLILGPYSDRVGRRPVIIGSSFLFMLSCIGCFLSKNIELFILMRFIQGATVCSVAVAGYAAIHESFSEKEVVKLIAMMSMAVVLAPMFGPLLGGYVITYSHWRIIFIILLFLSTIGAVGLFYTMPETLQIKNNRAMTFNNLWAEYKEVVKNKNFMTYSLMFGLYYSGILLWMTIGPFYLMKNYQLSPEEFGLWQIPTFGGFIIGAQIVRLLVDRLSLRKITLLGIGFGTLAVLVIVLSLLITASTPVMITSGMGIYGLGFGTMSAPINRLAFDSATGGKGVVNAVYCSCLLLLGSIMTIVISIANAESRIVWFGVSLVAILLMNVLGFNRERLINHLRA